jgi:serine/threonine protein kinase
LAWGALLAETQRVGRKVAIKFLAAEMAGDERAKQRLMREEQTAATLDHPNMCAFYHAQSTRTARKAATDS